MQMNVTLEYARKTTPANSHPKVGRMCFWNLNVKGLKMKFNLFLCRIGVYYIAASVLLGNILYSA